jgi:hypothetical protein
MAKDMGTFRDSQAPSWLSGPQMTELYLLLLCIQDMLSRHSAAQEITHS